MSVFHSHCQCLSVLFLLIPVLDLQKVFRAAPLISRFVLISCQLLFLRINNFVGYAFECVAFFDVQKTFAKEQEIQILGAMPNKLLLL